MESILTSIKKLLGIEESYTHFDQDLIIHINSILAILAQVGAGSPGFRIEGKAEVWDSFLNGTLDLETVKTYVYMRVRLLFDPPTSSALVESLTKQIAEFEWRIFVNEDNKVTAIPEPAIEETI